MFPVMLVLLPLLLLAALQAAPEGCRPESARALQDALAVAGLRGPEGAQAPLRAAAGADPACAALAGARWSIAGWTVARAAEAAGGSPESLTGAEDALRRLEEVGGPPAWRVESEYARAAIVAAMAAAQDERPEMAVYLRHARGLSDRLALAGAPPDWPLPIDTLEGELWLEVDRYDEARAAFERAAARQPTGFVLTRLGRTRAAQGDETGACAAYRDALEQSGGALRDEARGYLARPACADDDSAQCTVHSAQCTVN